jgi:hypothetical protein
VSRQKQLVQESSQSQSSSTRPRVSTHQSIRERCRNVVADTYLIAKTNWLFAPFLVLGWLLLPIQLVACLILRALRIRILTNQRWPQSYHHVGHLAIEFDGFFKDRGAGATQRVSPNCGLSARCFSEPNASSTSVLKVLYNFEPHDGAFVTSTRPSSSLHVFDTCLCCHRTMGDGTSGHFLPLR